MTDRLFAAIEISSILAVDDTTEDEKNEDRTGDDRTPKDRRREGVGLLY